MRRLPRIETVEEARNALLEMDETEEITAESSNGWEASFERRGDNEFSVAFAEHETGVISLRDASHILLEHADHDLHLAERA